MNQLSKALAAVALSAVACFATGVSAQDAVDKEGLTIYMQMGGNPADAATLARELGAREAARVLHVNLIEQHAGWDPQKMLAQANEALAAAPDAIVIMGHPGTDATRDFLRKAAEEHVVVVANNNPLPGTSVSYFGLDSFEAGKVMARETISHGNLKQGDKVLVYGTYIEGKPSYDVGQGVLEVLAEAGLEAAKVQWTDEAVLDPSLAVPVMVAFLESNPDTKAIIAAGHGGVTAVLDRVMRDAGKEPGSLVTAGFDISPAAVKGVKDGYLTLIVDQQPYLQGFMPIVAAVLEKRYGLIGLQLNTGGGVITKENIEAIEPLIKAGLR